MGALFNIAYDLQKIPVKQRFPSRYEKLSFNRAHRIHKNLYFTRGQFFAFRGFKVRAVKKTETAGTVAPVSKIQGDIGRLKPFTPQGFHFT